MNREPKTPPLHTWQIYSAALHYLTKEFVTKLYGISNRAAERWAANPDTTESSARNPMDRYEELLRNFCALGHQDIARIAVARQAALIGCELAETAKVEPDKKIISEECLDDYPPVTLFHEAITRGASLNLVRHLWQEAKRELDQTFTLYAKGEYGNGASAEIKGGKGD